MSEPYTDSKSDKPVKLTIDMLPDDVKDLYIMHRGKLYAKANLPSSVLAKLEEGEEGLTIGPEVRIVHTQMKTSDYMNLNGSTVLDKQAKILQSIEDNTHHAS